MHKVWTLTVGAFLTSCRFLVHPTLRLYVSICANSIGQCFSDLLLPLSSRISNTPNRRMFKIIAHAKLSIIRIAHAKLSIHNVLC